jgi:hypothetical protein
MLTRARPKQASGGFFICRRRAKTVVSFRLSAFSKSSFAVFLAAAREEQREFRENFLMGGFAVERVGILRLRLCFAFAKQNPRSGCQNFAATFSVRTGKALNTLSLWESKYSFALGIVMIESASGK